MATESKFDLLENGSKKAGLDPDPNLDLLPRYYRGEEYLSVLSPIDLQTFNKRIKVMCNKRDWLLESLEGKTILVTALIVDIVNSTKTVKKIPEELAGAYYQKFIEDTSNLIERYGGYVLKNVGDCVIGFFPSGKHMVENQDKAVMCGLAMPDMIQYDLNPYLGAKKMPPIQCRISADFGSANVVRVRSGDGYSAIDLFGSPMNSAAKIARYAKPGQVLVGDDLFWQLSDCVDFEFKLVNRWDPIGRNNYPVYIAMRKSLGRR
ncbi:MAG: adenylate/guanylate cyclase domain-containing protein [Nitrososphaerales archaeon]